MSEAKKQHYVPQFYLRNFLNHQNGIWAFDKVTKKSFLTNTKAIANEPFFYEQNSDLDKEGYQSVEKALGVAEQTFAPELDKLLQGLKQPHHSVISMKTKEITSQYLTMQIFRTKEYRKEMSDVFDAMRSSFLAKEWFNDGQIKQLGFSDNQENARVLSIGHLANDHKLNVTMVNLLQSHIWIIFKNQTNEAIYTSDNPVVRKAWVNRLGRSDSGWGSKGIEINFPLSSEYILTLYERSHFKAMEQFENSIIGIDDPQNIIYLNALQVSNSYRQIFCINDHFDLANEMVTTHPELRSVNRRRVDTD